MTTMLAEYDEELAPEELAELGWFNHSYLQTKLAVLLFQLDRYTVSIELSLDVSELRGVDDVVDEILGIRLPLAEIFS